MVAIADDGKMAEEIAEKSPFIRRGYEENYIIGDFERVDAKLKEYVRLGVTYFILRFLDFPNTREAEIFIENVIPKIC